MRDKIIEIECLACGKTLKMPKYIDADKYDGQVVCQECKSLLHVKLIKGKVQKYKIIKESFRNFGIAGAREKLLREINRIAERKKEKQD